MVALGDRRQRHAEGGEQRPGQSAGVPILAGDPLQPCRDDESHRSYDNGQADCELRAVGDRCGVPAGVEDKEVAHETRDRLIAGHVTYGIGGEARQLVKVAAPGFAVDGRRGEDRHGQRGDSGCQEDAPPARGQQERPEPEARHLEHQHESQRHARQPGSARIRLLREIQHSAEKKKQQRVALSLAEVVRQGNVHGGQRHQTKPGSDRPCTRAAEGLHEESQPRPPEDEATNDPANPSARRRHPGDWRQHEAHRRRLEVNVPHPREPEGVDSFLEPGIVVSAPQLSRRLQEDPRCRVVSRETVGVRCSARRCHDEHAIDRQHAAAEQPEKTVTESSGNRRRTHGHSEGESIRERTHRWFAFGTGPRWTPERRGYKFVA